MECDWTVPAARRLAGVVYPSVQAVGRWVALGAYTGETVRTALFDSFARHAGRVAIIARERTWTYRELDVESDRIAAALVRLGLQPLDRVLFQIGNVPQVFPALYGCWKAGLIPVCTLASHREHEITAIAQLTEARAHLVQGDLENFDLVRFACLMRERSPSMRHVIAVRATTHPHALSLELLQGAEEPDCARRLLGERAIHPLDVAVFQLSGGTTGTPKLIPRLHADYVYNMRACIEWMHFDSTTVCYWPFPAMHNAAMACFNTPTHLSGGSVVVQPDLSAHAFLATLQQHRVTVTGGFLPIIVRLIESSAVSQYDLSSVRQFTSLGESRRITRDLGMPGGHIFGMAEGLIMHTCAEDPEPVRFTMVGRPVSPHDEIRLCKPGTNELVPAGEVGELCTRGPYTLHGYYNAPEHNRIAFTADGFYRSGDLMSEHVVEGARYYRFEGRLKDNIDRGGEKIHAEEVEARILQHPAVLNVAVVGMPDPHFGERACAFLILERGHTAPTVRELGEFLERCGLARFKWPERIEVRDTFPTTKVGKVSKGLLRDEISAILQREAEQGHQASSNELRG